MSLDCYPFGRKQSISLDEQPLAIDVVSDDDLLICATNNCRSITIFDLRAEQTHQLVREFPVGEGIVIDRIVYCKTGDYIACVGHRNGTVSVYTIFDWRQTSQDTTQPQILDLNYCDSSSIKSVDVIDRRDKLTDIDCCQRTGNLAASYGDLIQIYRYTGSDQLTTEPGDDLDSVHSEAETVKDLLEDYEAPRSSSSPDLDAFVAIGLEDQLVGPSTKFKHIISLKLALWSSKVCLVENYLSITTVDHVQVIKLELLTLQIQSDGQDQDQQLGAINISGSSSIPSSGDPTTTTTTTTTDTKSPTNSDSNNLSPRSSNGPQQPLSLGRAGQSRVVSAARPNAGDPTNHDDTNSELSAAAAAAAATTTADGSTTNTTMGTSCSMLSEATTATNFSSFNTTFGAPSSPNNSQRSELSIITMQNDGGANHHQAQEVATTLNELLDSNDDCITWNLNTKKLVKLPTLMHNTSNSLSSYHICHPLELLGPASESIACRVEAHVHSDDYCPNQMEPIVMLCRQFDFDRDPVKLAHLQAIYLSSSEDQRRLGRQTTPGNSGEPSGPSLGSNNHAHENNSDNQVAAGGSCPAGPPLVKSQDYDLLTSVTYFVATLTTCFVYSLHGRKVARIQTITHPDVCLDLRPSLLNVYLLTPLGLQICSTGSCDSTFRYDWSSSADLNLSFMACNKCRVLASAGYIVLISSSTTTTTTTTTTTAQISATHEAQASRSSCLVEFLEKPSLIELSNRIYHTTNRCNSISVRSNLLSYLHASAQLALVCGQGRDATTLTDGAGGGGSYYSPHQRRDTIVEILRDVTVKLCEQLLLKKQTNVITNNKIDRTVKHLLDISYCDLGELMRRHLDDNSSGRKSQQASKLESSVAGEGLPLCSTQESGEDEVDEDEEDEEDEKPFDCHHELVKIYLKHAKCNASIMDYLQANSNNDLVASRLINYMYEHNPRLLIRCAKRFTWSSPFDGPSAPAAADRPPQPPGGGGGGASMLREERKYCVTLLVDKLRLLAELDSTGINRATVLFTLAILYDSLGDLQQCLTCLAQIKPLNHLAITMCSNHEVSHSIAAVVNEHYPEVFSLFLRHLARRDRDSARAYVRLYRSSGGGDGGSGELPVHGGDDPANDSRIRDRVGGNRSPHGGVDEADEGEEEEDVDEEDLFEQKLRIVAEIPAIELVELLAGAGEDHREAVRAHLKASIHLLESQFILSRLGESTQLSGGGGP